MHNITATMLWLGIFHRGEPELPPRSLPLLPVLKGAHPWSSGVTEKLDLNKSNTFTPCILLIPFLLTRVSHVGLRRTLLTGSLVHLMDRPSLVTFLMVILDISRVSLSFSSQTWSYNFSKTSQFLVWLRSVCGEAAAEGGSWRRQLKVMMCFVPGFIT